MKIKKYLTLFILSFTLFSFFGLSTAEAKRFGMGKSYGYHKKIAPKNFNRPANPKPAPAAQKPNAGKQTAGQPQRSGASRWLGPLAGLAAGGLLAAMLFGDGFEGLQIMDFLLFGLIAFGLFMLFKHFMRRQTAHAPHAETATASQAHEAHTQPAQAFQSSEPNHFAESGSIIGSALSEDAEPITQTQQIPEWFDEQGFLEAAKHNFVKVQQAWDNGDLATLQAYCAPELFSALKADIKPGENHTEVDTLYAEIADMAIEGDDLIVSVRFSGFIKEEKDADAHAFNDIWHLRRKLDGSDNWQIIGIQPGQPH